MEQAVSLFGSFDENIKIIEKEFDVSIISRGAELKITGEAENVSLAARAIGGMMNMISKGETLNEQNVLYVHTASSLLVSEALLKSNTGMSISPLLFLFIL